MAINRDKVLETAQKYVEKKKYDRAVDELRKLVAADPNDARTLLKIGDLQAKQGLHADAISTYESVGKLYAHQGFALKAIAVYKQIREIIAKHVPQLEERYGHIAPKLADLYQQLGLTSDALAALDEVATRLQRQQRDQEAIEVFRRIVELDPTNPLPHLRLAEALSRVKDVEGAVFEFKTAASQLSGIGRRDDALKVLERLLHHKADPEQARICAELYLSRGQPQDGMQALAKLQICFQANPRDFDTLSLLARAFNAIGQGPKAIEVQKEMARVARDTGKGDLFREIVERLLRVAPHDDGVRKLAQQSGSIGATAPPYGTAAMQGDVQPGMPSGSYPQQPPPVFGQPHMPPEHYGRMPTQPLRRPTDEYYAPPGASGATSLPPDALEEVDELSYQEVQPSDVIEDEILEAAEGYERQHYAADPNAYAADPNAYAADPNAYAADPGSYAADPSVHAAPDHYAPAIEQGYAEEEYSASGYERHEHYAADDEGGALEGHPEELMEPGAEYDVTEQIQQVLDDANAFRRVRLYKKALDALRLGLEVDPRSMDLHELYRDILIESGETEEAVDEMLAIASLYVDALDGDSAARALQDVLAFDPQNARAVEMLQELGYEIVDEGDELPETGLGAPAYEEQVSEYDPEHHPGHEGAPNELGHGYGHDEMTPEGEAGYEPRVDHRLPAYSLDEVAAAPAAGQFADENDIYSASGAPPELEEVYEDAGPEGLPAFPLDEPDHDHPGGYGDGHHAAMHRDFVTSTMRPDSAPAVPAAMVAGRELEDALDEAEFFCSRGLFDDARAILQDQLARHPNHPLLRERLTEIDAQEQQRGSGAREKPRESDRAFDIAASLDALETLGGDYGQPAEGFAEPDQQVDVEEVFAKFKEGVAKQISVDDSDSHYNLGIAYKEMMLLDDAIREFDIAARDPKRECVCRSMIGMIHIERGNLNEAIEAFLQGLNAPNKDPQQETVLCYEIGAAYEAKKLAKDALSYYQKAMRRDPNYRDVQERVRRLAKAESKTPLRQAAVGADDEFDRAFDDLLSKA